VGGCYSSNKYFTSLRCKDDRPGLPVTCQMFNMLEIIDVKKRLRK